MKKLVKKDQIVEEAVVENAKTGDYEIYFKVLDKSNEIFDEVADEIDVDGDVKYITIYYNDLESLNRMDYNLVHFAADIIDVYHIHKRYLGNDPTKYVKCLVKEKLPISCYDSFIEWEVQEKCWYAYADNQIPSVSVKRQDIDYLVKDGEYCEYANVTGNEDDGVVIGWKIRKSFPEMRKVKRIK